ncbi:Endothelin-converting enzyme 1 [Candidatus Koribacter versatilis Ellin345]|uniref:Endothelin-converting enzyme 1 n=1 Tax=Koribacter versatilis (strain Ellin345) TaxID=204669 RepID=Q1IVT6_KORVE|nr:M13 family metallopeptidase [Candidatus Koribacter versatilis]ABF39014.1 Endothelin-converting enzyme 1 [Candidatus Koribacter versatilis Ellin345]
MKAIQVVLGTALLLAGIPWVHGAPEENDTGFSIDALDRTADPCTDFYQFACGNWVKNHPLPAERTRFATFDQLEEHNTATLRTILDKASEQAKAGSADATTTKIGDYYAACMDESAIDAKGTAAIAPVLEKIRGMQSRADLPQTLAALHLISVDAFFGFFSITDPKDARQVIAATDQGGIGLPERDYYLTTDEKSVKLRAEYVAHIAKMLELAGTSQAAAAKSAEKVMALETQLAKISMDVVSRRDPEKLYNPSTREKLVAGSKDFNWNHYLAAVNPPQFEKINHVSPPFLNGLGAVLQKTDLAVIKDYLTWQTLHAASQELPTGFQTEEFHFYRQVLGGAKEQRPRWKRCANYTDNHLGEALGQVYVKSAFGAQAKERMETMVKNLEAALHEDISNLDWMSQDTKKQAMAKLDAMVDKIGYPDKWRDYSNYRVERGDALGNLWRGNEFEIRRQLNKIGKPVDKTEWGMTPPTVNAEYHPERNDITFPAGILQPPFFDNRLDDAINYGAIGAVIGHEMTHGFDDEGRQYDRDGNLHDWWTATDGKAFTDRAECIVNEYSGFEATEGVKLNGKLTLGENTADNGGVRVALMALLASYGNNPPADVDGFSPEQRFFLGYGHAWCANQTPESLRLQATTDPHSPGKWRVNGTVQNMPEFRKAFGCKAGMAMAPSNACRVW